MDEYSIRPLTEAEVPQIRPCLEGLAAYHNAVALSFSGVYPTIPIQDHLDHMQEHVRNNTAYLIGLFRRDGSVAGFGMSSIESTYGEIDYLYVDEDVRGSGMGRKLLDALMEKLRSQGSRVVDLKVVNGNQARQFYEKYGFALRSNVLAMCMDEK